MNPGCLEDLAMKLSVSQALHDPGVAYPFELEGSLSPIEYELGTITLASPVKISGTVRALDEQVYLDAQLTYSLSEQCARCAMDMAVPYQVPVVETFAPKEDEELPDQLLYRGETLEIQTLIEDIIVMALPIRRLCQPQCKGLCPVCGTNRNERDCGCDVEQEKTPFSALKTLLDQDKEG